MSIIFPYIILIMVNVIIFFKFDYIAKKINIFDSPDHNRKLHKTEVPLIGGTIIMFNFFLISLFYFTELDSLIFSEILFFNQRSFYVFIVGSISFFLLGIYDDKYHLNSYTRLILSSLFLFIILSIDQTIVISTIQFSFTDKIIYLENFSTIFTIICFILFINSVNMYDGINLQSSIYFFVLILFLIFNTFSYYFLSLLIIPICFFSYLNNKNRVFLGDGGTYILGFILSYIIVKSYNLENNLTADEIFIIMMVPGIELLRLAITRIKIGKSPFSADRNHIHHYLIEKMSIKKTNLLLFLLVFVPIMLIDQINHTYIILLYILIYIIILLRYK